jgi:hypothetical protein
LDGNPGYATVKVIDGCKHFLKIRHFIIKTKLLDPTITMSFDCKVMTPTIMHSGHHYKLSGSLLKFAFPSLSAIRLVRLPEAAKLTR